MDKISVVISCPIDTYSGYGARARDLVKALLKLEKYDVKVLSLVTLVGLKVLIE